MRSFCRLRFVNLFILIEYFGYIAINIMNIVHRELSRDLYVQVLNAIARSAGTVFLPWLRTIISVLFLAYVGEVELTGGTVAIRFANMIGFFASLCK